MLAETPKLQYVRAYAHMMVSPTVKAENPRSKVMPRSLLCGCLSSAAVDRVVDRAATGSSKKGIQRGRVEMREGQELTTAAIWGRRFLQRVRLYASADVLTTFTSRQSTQLLWKSGAQLP